MPRFRGKEWPTLFALPPLLRGLCSGRLYSMFRDDIRILLKRLRLLKLFGNELDVSRDLEQLTAEASAAAETAGPEPFDDRLSKQTLTEDAILQEASRSPKGALLLLSADIERELRIVFLATGWHNHIGGRPVTMREGTSVLVKQGGGCQRMCLVPFRYSDIYGRTEPIGAWGRCFRRDFDAM